MWEADLVISIVEREAEVGQGWGCVRVLPFFRVSLLSLGFFLIDLFKINSVDFASVL